MIAAQRDAREHRALDVPACIGTARSGAGSHLGEPAFASAQQIAAPAVFVQSRTSFPDGTPATLGRGDCRLKIGALSAPNASYKMEREKRWAARRGMSTLHQNAHLIVRHYRASAYVCVVRTTAPFDSVAEARVSLKACRITLHAIDASRHGILFDWRQAPISTDPGLHKTLVEYMDGMAEPFVRRAILLATTVGAMQANRVGRKSGEQVVLSVFGTEAAALEFVTSR